MDESTRILVDTSVWVGFFAGDPAAAREIAALRYSHRIVVCGQITQEVLQGTRDAAALARLERDFAIWDYEAERQEDFILAARTYARLRWKGTTVSPPDCLIAAVAQRCGFLLFATDPHFAKISDLRRYQPRPTRPA